MSHSFAPQERPFGSGGSCLGPGRCWGGFGKVGGVVGGWLEVGVWEGGVEREGEESEQGLGTSTGKIYAGQASADKKMPSKKVKSKREMKIKERTIETILLC